jgi:hypothetical protein
MITATWFFLKRKGVGLISARRVKIETAVVKTHNYKNSAGKRIFYALASESHSWTI